MDTLHELLSEIIKSPDADHLRLMYADALDERGDVQRMDAERAEFIRLQVALAKHPVRPVYDVDAVSVRNGLLHFYCEGVRRVQSGTRVDLRVLDAKRWERKSYHNVLVMEWSSDGIADARMDEHSVDDSDDVKGMREREGGLRLGYQYQWLGDESPWYSHSITSDWLTWKRGFIEEVQCPLNIFFVHTDDWLWSVRSGRTCPTYAHPVRKVVLTGSWIGISSLDMSSPSNKKFVEYIRNQEEYMIWDSIMDVNACVIRSLQNLWPTIQFEHKA